jgi:hypothetical protein
VTSVQAVPSALEPRHIRIPEDGHSLIGDVLTIASRLPKVAYDAAAGTERLDIGEDRQAGLIDEIGNTTFAFRNLVRIVGKLMSSQDATAHFLEPEDIQDLGFALAGLMHIVTALDGVADRLRDSLPTEAANG